MKKPIYVSSFLLFLLITMKGYSQTENKCYSFYKSEKGQIENIFVSIAINGKKVETRFLKVFKSGDKTNQETENRLATLIEDKIIFDSSKDKKANDLETEKAAPWIIKGDVLIVKGYTLKQSACN